MSATENTQKPKPIDLSYYLPFGEMLRVFLEQQYVNASDLRLLLRERGIFLPESDKAALIPPLALATITPVEFSSLLLKQRTREDSLKTVTQFVNWKSGSTLAEAIPTDFVLNNLVPEGSSYRVTGDLRVNPVAGDKDHLSIEYTVERADLHKDWTTGAAIYDGRVDIRKIGKGETAQLIITSTAPETKDVGKKIAGALTTTLKGNGHIDAKDQPRGLSFLSFSNAERVAFLLAFTQANTPQLRFEAITDYDVGPDQSKVMPAEIKQFVEQVAEFQLHGEKLQLSFFIQNTACHPFIIMSRMQGMYKFEHNGITGSCTVDFSFAGYSPRSKNGEFEVRLGALHIDRSCGKVSKLSIYRAVHQIVQDYAQQVQRAHTTKLSGASDIRPDDASTTTVGNGAAMKSKTRIDVETTAAREAAVPDPPVADDDVFELRE